MNTDVEASKGDLQVKCGSRTRQRDLTLTSVTDHLADLEQITKALVLQWGAYHPR